MPLSTLSFLRPFSYQPGNTVHLGFLGYAYALAGRKMQARKILEEHKKLEAGLTPNLSFALVHVGLAEKNQAIDCLEKAYQQHENGVLGLGMYPPVDLLRSEPRFQGLLRRIGLPESAVDVSKASSKSVAHSGPVDLLADHWRRERR